MAEERYRKALVRVKAHLDRIHVMDAQPAAQREILAAWHAADDALKED